MGCGLIPIDTQTNPRKNDDPHPTSNMSMSIDNDTTNQTSIELQETSHGEQKRSDKIVCSHDEKKTAIDSVFWL